MIAYILERTVNSVNLWRFLKVYSRSDICRKFVIIVFCLFFFANPKVNLHYYKIY
jgi:hypothetical protein